MKMIALLSSICEGDDEKTSLYPDIPRTDMKIYVKFQYRANETGSVTGCIERLEDGVVRYG